MSNINKHYTKEALQQILEGVFIQHRDQPHFLVLSDTNVFFDDESGRKLATEQATRSNARIFRFRNPHYAESEESGHIIIEDGDGNKDQEGPVVVDDQLVNEAPYSEEKEEEGDDNDEADVTEQVAKEVATADAKAKTSAATDVRGSKTTKTVGIKAKTTTGTSAKTTKTAAGVKAKK